MAPTHSNHAGQAAGVVPKSSPVSSLSVRTASSNTASLLMNRISVTMTGTMDLSPASRADFIPSMASSGFGENSLKTVLLIPWKILDIGSTESYSLGLVAVGTAVGSSSLDSAEAGRGVGVLAGCCGVDCAGGGGASSSSVGSSGGPPFDPQAKAKINTVAATAIQMARDSDEMCMAARSRWEFWKDLLEKTNGVSTR